MSIQSTRIKILIGITVIVLMLTQSAANAQERGPSMLKVGTMVTMHGVELINNEWIPFEQYMKCSGMVILPETRANMFYFLEYWGRDSGTMVMRIAPNGNMYYYSGGNEATMFLNGPVGTYWEITDSEYGQTIRGEIVANGITLTLPTGVTYNNLVRMNLYCMSCAADPILLESHWISPEIGFEVLVKQEDPPFWEWLVSITRK